MNKLFSNSFKLSFSLANPKVKEKDYDSLLEIGNSIHPVLLYVIFILSTLISVSANYFLHIGNYSEINSHPSASKYFSTQTIEAIASYSFFSELLIAGVSLIFSLLMAYVLLELFNNRYEKNIKYNSFLGISLVISIHFISIMIISVPILMILFLVFGLLSQSLILILGLLMSILILILLINYFFVYVKAIAGIFKASAWFVFIVLIMFSVIFIFTSSGLNSYVSDYTGYYNSDSIDEMIEKDLMDYQRELITGKINEITGRKVEFDANNLPDNFLK